MGVTVEGRARLKKRVSAEEGGREGGMGVETIGERWEEVKENVQCVVKQTYMYCIL